MNTCLYCNSTTSNPKFCSLVCSATFYNKLPRKRMLPQGSCKVCKTVIKTSLIYCDNCKQFLKKKSYCLKHNADFKSYGRQKRCSKCMSERVMARRTRIKEMAVEYKGGCCEICGYRKCLAALDFHHLEPEHKDFSISKYGHCRSWQRVKEEVDKCVLVCSNCHREIHFNMNLNKLHPLDLHQERPD